jgi:hypothetical protein
MCSVNEMQMEELIRCISMWSLGYDKCDLGGGRYIAAFQMHKCLCKLGILDTQNYLIILMLGFSNPLGDINYNIIHMLGHWVL